MKHKKHDNKKLRNFGIFNWLRSFFLNIKIRKIEGRKKIQLEKEKIFALKNDILKSKSEIKYVEQYLSWRKSEIMPEKTFRGGMITQLFLPKSKMIAFIFMRDGMTAMHTVSAEKQFFELDKCNYFIDPKSLLYVKTFNMWLGFYHQNVALPMNISSAIKELLRKIDNKEIDSEINLTLDSKVFERFIKSEFVQKLMTGAQLASELFFVKFMQVVQMIITIIAFLLTLILLFKK